MQVSSAMYMGLVATASACCCVSSSSSSAGMTHAVCCGFWQTSARASTTLAQHWSRPPGRVPQPAPPHVPPHEAGQQTVPVAETEPSLQKAVSCGSGLPW
jgi:hypothetical protein